MTDKDDVKEQIIETVDEEGTVVKFELIDIVELDEIEYGLLLPLSDSEDDEEEEDEVVIMRLKKEGEDFIFEAIEDDDEFDKVVEAIQDDAESEDDEE